MSGGEERKEFFPGLTPQERPITKLVLSSWGELKEWLCMTLDSKVSRMQAWRAHATSRPWQSCRVFSSWWWWWWWWWWRQWRWENKRQCDLLKVKNFYSGVSDNGLFQTVCYFVDCTSENVQANFYHYPISSCEILVTMSSPNPTCEILVTMSSPNPYLWYISHNELSQSHLWDISHN